MDELWFFSGFRWLRARHIEDREEDKKCKPQAIRTLFEKSEATTKHSDSDDLIRQVPVQNVEHILRIVAIELPAGGVESLLIGGFAVNHYGYSRNTLDIDFMVMDADQCSVREVMKRRAFIDRAEMGTVASLLQKSPFRDVARASSPCHNEYCKRLWCSMYIPTGECALIF